MGFISFTPPPFDLDEWKAKPHLERIKPLAQDWAVNGFGTPIAVYLLYVFKLMLFCLGALLVISTTPGIGGLGDFGDWWTEPIVFQKLVVWTLLWEVLGIGSGSMPLTFRFAPPVGGFLYWLRPGHAAARRRGRTRCRSPRARAARCSTSRSTPACSSRRCSFSSTTGRCSTPRRSASCSACSLRSACATRCRSSPPGPRSTGSCSWSACSPPRTSSSRGRSSSSASGGARRRRSSTATSRMWCR